MRLFGKLFDNSNEGKRKESSSRKVAKFEELIPGLPKYGLYLLLGIDSDGHPTYTDLGKAQHILVAGTTGSGKSELLHTFIASLIYRRNNNPCEIVIIDLKRDKYSMYENRNGVYVVTKMSDAISKLERCCDIVEDRNRLLKENHCKNINDLNDSSIHPIVLIVDELKDLLIQDKRAEQYLVRLAKKASNCGIYLILSTQAPGTNVITGAIKANIPTKIALRTTFAFESRIVIERNGAEKLFGKGDMLYLGNSRLDTVRIQAAYTSNERKEEIANTLSYEKHNSKQAEKPFDYVAYYKSQGLDLEAARKFVRTLPDTKPRVRRRRSSSTNSNMLAMRTSRRSR